VGRDRRDAAGPAAARAGGALCSDPSRPGPVRGGFALL